MRSFGLLFLLALLLWLAVFAARPLPARPLAATAAGGPDEPLTGAVLLARARERSLAVVSGSLRQETAVVIGSTTVRSDVQIEFDGSLTYARATTVGSSIETVFEGASVCVRIGSRPWRARDELTTTARPLRSLASIADPAGGVEQLPDQEFDGVVYHRLRVAPDYDGIASLVRLSGLTSETALPDYDSVRLDLYVDPADLLIKRASVTFSYELTSLTNRPGVEARSVPARATTTLRLLAANEPPVLPRDLPVSCGPTLA